MTISSLKYWKISLLSSSQMASSYTTEMNALIDAYKASGSSLQEDNYLESF